MLGFRLLTITSTPPCCDVPSDPEVEYCRPSPTVTPLRLIPGWGFTVTVRESDAIFVALATRYVVHGRAAEPAYAIAVSVLTRPVAIVTGDVAVTHAGSRGVSVTGTPEPGAAIGDPPLSSRIVSVSPNVA